MWTGSKLGARLRAERWGLVVFAATLVTYAWIWWNDPASHRTWSDGYFNYIYARSIVFDHDINFTNDYALCGDPQTDIHRIYFSDVPFNGSFIGSSIYFVPMMWIVRHLIHLPPGTPESVVGACEGPITQWTLSIGVFLGALTFWLSYRAARRFASDGSAAVAAAFFAFGSTLTPYASQNPCYTHTYEAFSAAVALLLAVRADERPSSKVRWFLAGAYCGVALLMRPNCVVLAMIPATIALFHFWKEWRQLAIAWAVIVAGVFVFGLVPLAAVNDYLFGRFSPFAARDKHQLQFMHPHPWLLLFAPVGGLFYWTPAAWLSVFGLSPGLKNHRSRAIVAGFVAASIPMIYICASVLDWHGATSFGARRLTPLVPGMVLVSAILIDRIEGWLRAKPTRATTALAFATVIPVGLAVTGPASAIRTGKMNWWDHPLTQEELYGHGASMFWYWMDQGVGDLAVLPAELVYRVRYGLPMYTFRDATIPWYSRHSRLMYWKPNLPSLLDAHVTPLETNLAPGGGGVRMTEHRARVVMTTEWPVSTEIRVTASSQTPAHLRVGSGHAFGRVAWLGTIDLPGNDQVTSATLPVPKGEFESGMNEFVFESADVPRPGIVLRELALDDTTPYPPMYPPLRN